jgi:hypothetical protein
MPSALAARTRRYPLASRKKRIDFICHGTDPDWHEFLQGSRIARDFVDKDGGVDERLCNASSHMAAHQREYQSVDLAPTIFIVPKTHGGNAIS